MLFNRRRHEWVCFQLLFLRTLSMAYDRKLFAWKDKPWRYFYMAYSLMKLFLVLELYWRARYALPRFRPHESWPLLRCLWLERVRFFLNLMSECVPSSRLWFIS